MFQSMIHCNSSLSERQKLQYLKSSLSGEVANIIELLEFSNANYEVAWTLLCMRYDNRRIIVQGHIEAIMSLPSMKKENHSKLRKITNGATRHLHALQALKLPITHWDALIIHILYAKLDPLMSREW